MSSNISYTQNILMAELDPGIIPQDIERAEVIVFGGALTVDACRDIVYDGVLGDDSVLSPSKRFYPNPRSSMGDLVEMRKRCEGYVEQVVSKLDQRVMLVGHSLGGLEATDIGCRRPDLVAGVVNLAGLQDGLEEETWLTWAIKEAAGNPADAELLMYDSSFMQEHRAGIAENWSERVSLASLVPTYDACFPRLRGLGLELPEGQEHTRRIVAPGWLMNFALLRITGIPKGGLPKNLERLSSHYLTEHTFFPRSNAVVEFVRDFRIAVVENGLEIGDQTVTDMPESEPYPLRELQAA